MSEDEMRKDESEHYTDLDLADEEQIIQEMSGRASEKYIYELKQTGEDGQPVMGLSYAGTNWACRELAQQGEVIRVVKQEDVSDPADPEFIKIAVMTQRFKIDKETGRETALDSHISGKRQPRNMTKNVWENGVKKGTVSAPDPFAWEKCLSKAVRNAKQALMPADMVRKLIAKVKTEAGKPKSAGSSKLSTPQADSKPTPAAPPQGTQPPAKSAPPTQQAAPQPAASAAPPETAKPKMSKEVLIQKLDAVTKILFQTQDGAVARQKLAALTGKASPSELVEEQIKNIGNAINAVVKKTAAIEGNDIIKLSDRAVLWKGPEVPKQEAPAEEASDIMF